MVVIGTALASCARKAKPALTNDNITKKKPAAFFLRRMMRPNTANNIAVAPAAHGLIGTPAIEPAPPPVKVTVIVCASDEPEKKTSAAEVKAAKNRFI
jgi:hypothetical protein